MDFNTYVGRFESFFNRLEPPRRRLGAPWVRLGAGKNNNLSENMIKNQAFNLYASTTTVEGILGGFEYIFGPSRLVFEPC